MKPRPARKEDAAQLAVLMDIASQGLTAHMWAALAARDQSPLEIGRSRIRDNGELPSHFSNWMVLENETEICGGFAGCMIAEPYDPGDISELPEAYRPLLELEALAKGSWFLAVLAVFPEYRRRGIAWKLLKSAERQARHTGSAQMALTVSNQNTIAKELYLKNGFKEKARRQRIPIIGPQDGDEWLLLVKQLNL